ncbi:MULTISPECIES: copper chaperone PCu(A)C [unclassified Wenzhouxiangella]|uniref:copper chaperone PCu(A)C n=1 Tax=unclassified Wenzhouxiangella TaxID=2613841 RepID=UPI000E329127|nr:MULTISPECIES: copper chaperone PCu(A)C [unclassified Wenzhouxiangella]RFF27036.1 copper chaperone PCu(A)C [Wenzhouxiangella sp. 15181]RFP67547.1 copper chaperone PCu(A)C [Wenzhouxiangella sp. 15190]
MKIVSGVLLVIVLLAGALWWVSDMAPAEPIEIENPRVRLVPGGAPMAGYFSITNHTDAPIRLVSAASDAFGHVMIHRTVVTDGGARMEHQDQGVLVGAGETVAFEPKGLHLMLMRAQRELEVGDAVDVVFGFEGVEPAEYRVTFTVVPVTSS